MQLLPKSAYRRTLWKNGGGVTYEIARDPAEPYSWRISLAEVGADGDFSAFPNMQRILTVIEGAGIDLVGPTATVTAQPLHPTHFSGNTPIFGQLVDGAIRDLNLIYNPHKWHANVHLAQGTVTPKAKSLTYLFALPGQAIDSIPAEDTAAVTEPITIPAPLHALILELTAT